MLEIINQEGLRLQPDAETVIPVEVFNPLFNENNELFQEIIYSAQAGLTEINKAFIKNGHLVEASNSVYEQPVRVFYRGAAFYAGTFRFKISADKINFDLKVNFGTVAQKIKNAKMRDIITLDPVDQMSKDQLETLMKNTCLFPEQYPYAFFPVKNTAWTEPVVPIVYPWLNNWDHAAQKFKTVLERTWNDPRSTVIVPFFKLAYILKKVFEYLRFTLEGDLLTDPDFLAIYLYTRRPLVNYAILPSMCYLSDQLTLNDFLKQIGTRLMLNFNYNVMNNSVTIESPISALKESNEIDISNYIDSVEEISTAEKKGYSVTLKPDETDKIFDFAKADADDRNFQSLFTLKVGDAQDPVELEVSTLKQVNDTEYSYPETNQTTDLAGLSLTTVYPIRLLRFYGMKALSGNKVYPEALAYDLGDQESSYYRFRNDSKKVIINASIPPGVLAKFKPTSKFGFITPEGAYQKALNVKYAYNLSAVNTELLAVKIECQTIVNYYDTPFSLDPYIPEADDEILRPIKYKFCYEDGSQPDESLKVEPVPNTGSPIVMASTAATAPADAGGIGGQVGLIYVVSGANGRDQYGYKVRIYDKQPLYAIINGKKVQFTKESNYYVTPGMTSADGRPALIVF